MISWNDKLRSLSRFRWCLEQISLLAALLSAAHSWCVYNRENKLSLDHFVTSRQRSSRNIVSVLGYASRILYFKIITFWDIDLLIDSLIDYDGVRLTSQYRGHYRPIVHSRVNVSGEPWWWWCRLGVTPDLSRARWQSYKLRHLERIRGMDEGMRILHIPYLWYVNGSSTCHKILRHGTSGFTSGLKRGVLRILNALKSIASAGFEPQTLGPVANITLPLHHRGDAFWDIVPCSLEVDRRFPFITRKMEAAPTSETSVYFNKTTRRYNPRRLSSSHSSPWKLEVSQSYLWLWLNESPGGLNIYNLPM
jgi:hypothetical protein